MKKIIPILLIGTILLTLNSYTYAINSSFNFSPSELSFSKNSKKNDVTNKFSKYELTKKLESSELDTEKLKNLTKRTTTLLLGKPDNEETNESYYQRHQEYLSLGLYNAFPKDKNTKSGYDESNPNYRYAVASELAIPQLFNTANELEIKYSQFGQIKVTGKDDLAICTISLPNITVKTENKENPMTYIYEEKDFVLTYYFVKVSGEYYLGYLYGESTENIEDYLEEVESLEGANGISILSSYGNELREIYDYSKIDSLSDEQITEISNNNKNNLLILESFYNGTIVASANGFIISPGIVVTTWSFLEEALINGQRIIISDTENTYSFDGVVTANPETDIAVIKLSEQTKTSAKLANIDDINIENPSLALISKTGTGLTVQKGIVVSKEGYIQTSIPISKKDQGSILLDENGNVMGMNINKSSNSNISYAIGSDILSEIKDKFELANFEEIETISFDELKNEFYYTKYNDEVVSNNVPQKQWEKYSKIGKLTENIKFELIKANYENGILSLRYENPGQSFITSMQYAGKFKKELVSEGYSEILNQTDKSIYQNDEYKIIIMQEFNYLIIVMVRL